MKCKYQTTYKDHIICNKDNTRRTNGCPCSWYTPTLWQRVKEWFNAHFE